MVRNVLYLFPLECFLGMETEMIGFLHCYPSLTEELVENEVRRLLRCLDEREGVVTLQSLKEVHLKRLDATRDSVLLTLFAKNPTVLSQVVVMMMCEAQVCKFALKRVSKTSKLGEVVCVFCVALTCMETRATLHLKIAATNYTPFVRFMKDCGGEAKRLTSRRREVPGDAEQRGGLRDEAWIGVFGGCCGGVAAMWREGGREGGEEEGEEEKENGEAGRD